MLRLTREGKPNLFIYKHQIRTITEVGKLAPRRAKAAAADKAVALEANGSPVNEAGS
jgi:host factor-I protein